MSFRLTQDHLFKIYRTCERQYDVPWYILAAIDRYAELTKSKAIRSHLRVYGFVFKPPAWAGLENPEPDDINPQTIRLFQGLGVDEEKHSFGAGRSYGGARRHEGVDIFASYGTPVLSSCYGYIELMGWNRLGGWRVGLRDANNVYYYYAHLSRFTKGLKQGDLVRPGQVIGYVGSSGYGRPGTSGKFPLTFTLACTATSDMWSGHLALRRSLHNGGGYLKKSFIRIKNQNIANLKLGECTFCCWSA